MQIRYKMIWCGECGYNGKGLYLENKVYCPYCKATENDIVVLPIDNNTRNLTDEETDIYNSWLEAESETIEEASLFKGDEIETDNIKGDGDIK